MRRRQDPSARVWTSADLPPHLALFVPIDWGCFEDHWHAGRDCRGHAAWWQARNEWLREHGVDCVRELQQRVAARRRAVAEAWRHNPNNPDRIED